MRLAIAVSGRPAPQGSHETGSAGQFLDSSVHLKAWRQAIRIGAFRAYAAAGIPAKLLPVFPLGLPVIIEQCTFYVSSQQCRAADTDDPIGKPDVDKLLRGLLDGLGGGKDWAKTARLYRDDSQVTKVRELEKVRALSDDKIGAFVVVSDGRDR